jgi:hypothetical protein
LNLVAEAGDRAPQQPSFAQAAKQAQALLAKAMER